ncbi:hypothetical protein FRB93_008025 [Tulasnella sp. JGI-2019a]|nr:hypothetical protein FRB93_008025 [Tulasnella sp. JGI-2019a]
MNPSRLALLKGFLRTHILPRLQEGHAIKSGTCTYGPDKPLPKELRSFRLYHEPRLPTALIAQLDKFLDSYDRPISTADLDLLNSAWQSMKGNVDTLELTSDISVTSGYQGTVGSVVKAFMKIFNLRASYIEGPTIYGMKPGFGYEVDRKLVTFFEHQKPTVLEETIPEILECARHHVNVVLSRPQSGGVGVAAKLCLAMMDRRLQFGTIHSANRYLFFQSIPPNTGTDSHVIAVSDTVNVDDPDTSVLRVILAILLQGKYKDSFGHVLYTAPTEWCSKSSDGQNCIDRIQSTKKGPMATKRSRKSPSVHINVNGLDQRESLSSNDVRRSRQIPYWNPVGVDNLTIASTLRTIRVLPYKYEGYENAANVLCYAHLIPNSSFWSKALPNPATTPTIHMKEPWEDNAPPSPPSPPLEPFQLRFIRKLDDGRHGAVSLGRIGSDLGPLVVGKCLPMKALEHELKIYRSGLKSIAGDIILGVYDAYKIEYAWHPECGFQLTALLLTEYAGEALPSFEGLNHSLRSKVLRAAVAFHLAGFSHNDLRPANVTANAQSGQVAIIDTELADQIRTERGEYEVELVRKLGLTEDEALLCVEQA